ncbi:MAG: NAD-dependent epimerase/dehydratase family protein [Flavobacteriales bacterium]|nr:NAD-dependent epimerase/dehydratase family protein [Bacteroidota bacterium]MCB9240562.1 NAD-dependent epimerase/dehydratase family protein [Flavobacteriales bacterium]
MNVLITGATGFLGGRLVEYFSDKSEFNRILATGRTLKSNELTALPGVFVHLGELDNREFVDSLFDDHIDLIIHCAGLSSPWGSFDAFHRANVISQENLIRRSAEQGQVRIIYISTPTIYFNFKDRLGLREDDELPNKFVNHYASTKYAAERMLAQSGLDHIIMRPRALIGRGDTVIMPRLIRAHREGKLRVMGNGTNRVDLTPVGNMCEAVYRASVADEAAWNTDYNISNGEPASLWEKVNLILELLDEQPVSRRILIPVARGAARLMELKSTYLGGGEPPLTRYSVGVLSQSFGFDIRKSKEMLGYQPRQSVDHAIHEFAEWYKKEHHDQG